MFRQLNAKLNPISHLLALLGAHNVLHFSGVRVKFTNKLTDESRGLYNSTRLHGVTSETIILYFITI